jgi:hypothetical protein
MSIRKHSLKKKLTRKSRNNSVFLPTQPAPETDGYSPVEYSMNVHGGPNFWKDATPVLSRRTFLSRNSRPL